MKNLNLKVPLILLLGLSTKVNAQVVPQVAKNYPIAIVEKVQKIALKTNISAQRQILLAKYFQQRDSSITVEMAKGLPVNEAITKYTDIETACSQVLSPIELNDFLVAINSRKSLAALSVVNRDKLNLSNNQVSMLLQLIQRSAPNGPIKTAVDAGVNQISEIHKILNDDQLKDLFTIVNHSQALKYAITDWHFIIRTDPEIGLDSVNTVDQFSKYQLNVLNKETWGLLSGNTNHKDLVVARPPLMLVLDAFKGRLASKNLGIVIRGKSKLKLNEDQFTNVLNAANKVENYYADLKSKNLKSNFDLIGYEKKWIDINLKGNQYDKYLVLKNSDRAMRYALDEWSQLQKLSLVQASDSIKVYTSLYNYQLAASIANDRMPEDVTRFRRDSLRRQQQLSAPFLALKLDAYNGKLPASRLADVSKYCRQINLADIQIDSIVIGVLAAEKIKKSNPANHIYDNVNVTAYENNRIVKILTPRQYDFYLYYKVEDKAKKAAANDWKKLKEFKLIGDVDSVKTYNSILDFEHKWLVASERLTNQKTQQNSFMLLTVENTKPRIIEDMQAKMKELAAANTAKKTFNW
jgi:hypothetical protein